MRQSESGNEYIAVYVDDLVIALMNLLTFWKTNTSSRQMGQYGFLQGQRQHIMSLFNKILQEANDDL
jgi:hypothetical protein